MGLHRTFLFLLVLGLIIAAFRRGGGGASSSDPRQAGPPAGAKPAATSLALTNSNDEGLAAAGRDANK